MKIVSVLALLIFICLVVSGFISIRDDRDDSAYLALGLKYQQVCRVGERGGDGTLIASQWVITAAHVAEGMRQRYGNNLKIYFQGNEQGVSVKGIYIHPEFTPMGNHDIALVELARPVSSISPAGLYTKRDEEGKEIIIVGHGDFKTGKGSEWIVDGKKRGATNRIEKVDDNHIIYHFDPPDSKKTTHLEGTAGRGDSGGPAFIINGKQILVAGISSAGMAGDNGPGTYGAIEHYTRVSTHLEWINAVMGGLVKEQMPHTHGYSRSRPNVLEGLGLILEQGNDRILVVGKVDPEVPEEFRHILFNPQPSFIVSLNGRNYGSLDELSKAFKEIKKGSQYEIEFSVRGESLKFITIR